MDGWDRRMFVGDFRFPFSFLSHFLFLSSCGFSAMISLTVARFDLFLAFFALRHSGKAGYEKERSEVLISIFGM